MGKNTKGGNHKHMKNKRPARELVKRSAGQFYAQVVANNGNGRLSIKVINSDGSLKDAQAIIRGSCRRCRFEKLDMVLVGLREFTKEEVYDVCVKYTPDHAAQLVHCGEIPNIISGSGLDGITFVKQSDDDNLYEMQDDDEDYQNEEDEEDDKVEDELSEKLKKSDLSSDSDSEKDLVEESERIIKGSVLKKLEQITAKGKSSKAGKAKINAQRSAKNAELDFDLNRDFANI